MLIFAMVARNPKGKNMKKYPSQDALQISARDILLDRAADRPVNFQMELWPSGRFVYRFDLSRLDVDELMNVLVGASLGGAPGGRPLPWTTNGDGVSNLAALLTGVLYVT